MDPRAVFRLGAISTDSEIFFPVAYSMGGFAQLRRVIADAPTDLIGPLPHFASFDPILPGDYASSDLRAAASPDAD